MKIQTTALVLALTLFGLSGTGCYAHAHGSGASAGADVRVADPGPGCSGVLNCTANFAQQVVMFPFRLIAAIF
jgi:hypothetical protein